MNATKLDTKTFSADGCFVRAEAGFVCSKCGSGNLVILPTRSGAILMCADCTNSQKMVIAKSEEKNSG